MFSPFNKFHHGISEPCLNEGRFHPDAIRNISFSAHSFPLSRIWRNRSENVTGAEDFVLICTTGCTTVGSCITGFPAFCTTARCATVATPGPFRHSLNISRANTDGCFPRFSASSRSNFISASGILICNTGDDIPATVLQASVLLIQAVLQASAASLSSVLQLAPVFHRVEPPRPHAEHPPKHFRRAHILFSHGR